MDSNHRHRAYETPALPTELRRHGRSYDTSPEGGLAEDQRIIKKRTDGVKPRLASREDAASARAADLRGRFSEMGADSRPPDDVAFRVVRARYPSVRSTAAGNSGGASITHTNPAAVNAINPSATSQISARRTRCRRRNRRTCGPTIRRRPAGASNSTPWENQDALVRFRPANRPGPRHRTVHRQAHPTSRRGFCREAYAHAVGAQILDLSGQGDRGLPGVANGHFGRRAEFPARGTHLSHRLRNRQDGVRRRGSLRAKRKNLVWQCSQRNGRTPHQVRRPRSSHPRRWAA